MTRTIGLSLGDRHGIGPELVAALLSAADVVDGRTPVLVVGDRTVLQAGAQVASAKLEIVETSEPVVPSGARWALLDRPRDLPNKAIGRATEAAGREMLANLAELADLAIAGSIAGIVYAPLNKSALRMAGHAEGDELTFLVGRMKPASVFGEINILDGLWTSRVTSHVPIRHVADALTPPAIVDAIRLIASALMIAGRDNPRIAVAALNPHAGEGGAFGREEIDVIAPAVALAAAEGLDVVGPFPADTVFPRAKREGFDGIVTMFHDQGQIALKILGLGRGVTMLAGLPVPMATPGHGTAYDIAGKGIANREGLSAAFRLVADIVCNKKR
jgi:4-hydroxy-L-threonine phosphate dehydrogenase PdxA